MHKKFELRLIVDMLICYYSLEVTLILDLTVANRLK